MQTNTFAYICIIFAKACKKRQRKKDTGQFSAVKVSMQHFEV